MGGSYEYNERDNIFSLILYKNDLVRLALLNRFKPSSKIFY